MVKLPDSSNLRRNIPQATSAIQSVPVAMDFQAMQGAGQQLQQTSNQLFAQQQRDALYEQRQQRELLRQQEKQDNEIKKLRVAQATSRINTTISSTLAGLEEEQDYTKYPQIFDNQFKKLNETISKDFADDPIGREWINLKLNEAYNEANIKIYEQQKTKQKDAIRASTFQASDDFIQQFALAKTPEERERLKSDFRFIADSATGAGGFDKEEIQSVISDTSAKAEKNRLDTLTDEEVIEEFGGKNNEGGNSDVIHLLKMSKIEASYNPKAVNSVTKKKGLGQFDEATARENGVTDPFDITQAIKGSMAKDKKDSVYFEQQVGRKPVGWERYLIHQQGVGGAPALIKNADKNVVDALMTVKEYRDNPEKARMAVVQNGGSVDMTAGEFANLWRDEYENTDISDAPEEIINVVNSVVGGNDKSTVSQGYIIKRLNKAEKAVREKDIETQVKQITSALTSKTYNPKQQRAELYSANLDQEITDKVDLSITKMDTELSQDPIGYFENESIKTGQGFNLETAIEAQKQRGTPESRALVLSKSDSEMVTQNLLSIKTVPEMKQWLDALKQKTSDKYVPQAFRQLVKGGLPKEYQFVLSLNPDKDADEMRVMFNALSVDKKDFNEAFKTKLLTLDEKKEAFDVDFNAELQGVIDQEIKKGTNGIQDYNDSLKLMAQSHFVQYGDKEKAIAFAKNSYMKNYHNDAGNFYDVDGVPLAIPLTATTDPRFVTDELEVYKDNNIDDVFTIEGDFREIKQSQKQSVMDNSYFALNPQEDGVILYNEAGLMVLNKDRKPIQFKFTDLVGKAEKNKKSLQAIVQKEQQEKQARLQEQEKIEANKPIELFGD